MKNFVQKIEFSTPPSLKNLSALLTKRTESIGPFEKLEECVSDVVFAYEHCLTMQEKIKEEWDNLREIFEKAHPFLDICLQEKLTQQKTIDLQRIQEDFLILEQEIKKNCQSLNPEINDNIDNIFEFALEYSSISKKQKGSIVLLDSNPNTQASLTFRLENEGHYVRIARSCEEILPLLKAKETDVLMVDGHQFSALSEDIVYFCKMPKNSIAMIIVGNIEDNNLITSAFAKGFEDFLARPLNGSLLKVRILSALERRQIAIFRHEKLQHIHDAVHEMEASLETIEDVVLLFSSDLCVESHDQKILEIMPHFLRAFEVQDEDYYLKGLSFASLYHAHFDQGIMMHEDFENEEVFIQHRLCELQKNEGQWEEKLSDGRVLSCKFVTAEDGKKMIMMRDESLMENGKYHLAYMAYYDSLTGMMNRQFFTQRMEQLCSRDNPQIFYLMMLDLDGFKAVNDTYGHEMGDWILIQVTQRMKGMLRQGDLLARLGGDEFTIILNKVNDEDVVLRVAERIIKCVNKPFIRDDVTIHIGVSIGISQFTGDGTNTATLLIKADSAMYEVKEHGKNSVSFFKNLSIEEPILFLDSS